MYLKVKCIQIQRLGSITPKILRWSPFVSIQWRRFFFLSLTSNWEFTSKQREAVNWQLVSIIMCMMLESVEIAIEIESCVNCIDVYDNDRI